MAHYKTGNNQRTRCGPLGYDTLGLVDDKKLFGGICDLFRSEVLSDVPEGSP